MNMAANLHSAPWLLPALLIITSCSVKEDRSPCPCWLTVDGTDAFRVSDRPSLRIWSGADGEVSETLTEGGSPSVREYTVPRGTVTVSLHSGPAAGREEKGKVLFADNLPADTLWAHASAVDCRGEEARDTVRMRRQFAKVTLRPREGSWSASGVRSMSVSTSCGGLDLRTLEPLDGGWGMPLDTADDTEAVFHVPRLRQESRFTLLADIGGGTEERDLQAVLRQTGYDWGKADLDDITLTLDGSLCVVEVTVEPWKGGDEYDEHI